MSNVSDRKEMLGLDESPSGQYQCTRCGKSIETVYRCDVCQDLFCWICIQKNWKDTDWNVCILHKDRDLIGFVLEESAQKINQLKMDYETLLNSQSPPSGVGSQENESGCQS